MTGLSETWYFLFLSGQTCEGNYHILYVTNNTKYIFLKLSMQLISFNLYFSIFCMPALDLVAAKYK